jgi:hypothetical protein
MTIIQILPFLGRSSGIPCIYADYSSKHVSFDTKVLSLDGS